ncbi:hypothetical protein PAP_00910 [Palaeococcus pacificus DY20341]|uniref:Calcineurin-like phosphoesterase domain-containing protein n=2 Tax=Palaeococcus TaxID=83867 RepID=A0A075LPN6_9EURY|nr:hypothetical protein PAP_00910 [Palaeococcus pacificus DY20341]
MTTTPTKTYAPIDFKKAKRGEIVGNWDELFDTGTIYVSADLVDLAKHYFPNAEIRPSHEFSGGVAILSPGEARALLRGKPMLITINSYFGYIAYKVGYKFIGEDIGMIIAYKEDGNDRLIFTGNGKAGIGAALKYAMDIKEGKKKVNPSFVTKKTDFEGVIVKEIGDNDWDGIPDEDEYWIVKDFAFDEPFIFNWRIVKGENVTVSGGFIRSVNGSTVYIRALSFDVKVNIETPKGETLTYVIENINPKIMELPEGAEAGDTWVKFTTNEEHFEIRAKDLENYTFLVFGDHRPGSGTKQPQVFFKIKDMMNNDEGVFFIDTGDLVFSGKVEEWGELMKIWDFNRPVFIAVGNHEYQGQGKNVYKKLFGPTDYSFALGNYYFIFMNNVERGYSLSSSQWSWLEGELQKANETGKMPIIIMHAPPVDPRPGESHAMKSTDGEKLMELMRKYNAFGFFGHIHMYWYGEKDGVEFVVAGGGGAPIYAKPDEGGFYHYVRVNVTSGIIIEPVKVE